MKFLCRVGIHKPVVSSQVPGPHPALLVTTEVCARPGCTHSSTFESVRPGWVSERICDDPSCFYDGEHPPHTQWQADALAAQRAKLRAEQFN